MAASWVLQAIYASLLSQSLSPDKSLTDSNTSVITSTSYGNLQGVRKLTATNVLVDSYLGIPFALPPVGLRRFGQPEPPSKWTGVRDASQFGNECLQRNTSYVLQVGKTPVNKDEDCLYLNVYVPYDDVKGGQPLAVMVWIHGGGFTNGAGSEYDGSELATNGVIVVTVNYRLDVFGFLSNEGDEMPGNYGMLDQVMALKWVKDNIGSFGGNPNEVTIVGQSAGSASVSLLTLSPLASGLFQRAIMESGVSLSPWAVASPAKRLSPKTSFSLIGTSVGCVDLDMSKKLQCFRNLDPMTLLNASISLQQTFPEVVVLTPRVENIYSFLPDYPVNLLSQNKFNHVDTIRGYNTDETAPLLVHPGEEKKSITKEEFLKIVKHNLQAYVTTVEDKFVNEISAKYVGNETDGSKILYAAVRAETDYSFVGPTVIESNLELKHAKEKNHFLYEFQHKPSFSLYPSWLNNAVHGEELALVFGVNLPEFMRLYGYKTPSKEDSIVSNQMQTLWSNFAKYGDPTKTVPTGAVSWTLYDSTNAKYLKIDPTSQVLSFTDTRATEIYAKLLKQLQSSFNPDPVVG